MITLTLTIDPVTGISKSYDIDQGGLPSNEAIAKAISGALSFPALFWATHITDKRVLRRLVRAAQKLVRDTAMEVFDDLEKGKHELP